MGWFFKKMGTDKEGLKKSVMEEVCPDAVKRVICELLDDATLINDPFAMFVIESEGHFAMGFGGSCKILVNQTKLVVTAQDQKA